MSLPIFDDTASHDSLTIYHDGLTEKATSADKDIGLARIWERLRGRVAFGVRPGEDLRVTNVRGDGGQFLKNILSGVEVSRRQRCLTTSRAGDL